jgi:hypothetical protein
MARNNPLGVSREGTGSEVIIDGGKYFPSATVPAFREFRLAIYFLPSHRRGDEIQMNEKGCKPDSRGPRYVQRLNAPGIFHLSPY